MSPDTHPEPSDAVAAKLQSIAARVALLDAGLAEEILAVALEAMPAAPAGFEWLPVEDTTPSGKMQYRCSLCGLVTPTPDKWQYHAPYCKPAAEVTDEAVREALERLRSRTTNEDGNWSDKGIAENSADLATVEARLSEIERLRDYDCRDLRANQVCILQNDHAFVRVPREVLEGVREMSLNHEMQAWADGLLREYGMADEEEVCDVCGGEGFRCVFTDDRPCPVGVYCPGGDFQDKTRPQCPYWRSCSFCREESWEK